MLPIGFIYVAAAMRLGGGLAYLRATVRGQAKPNPLSWLLWGVTALIAFFAEISAGVGIAAIVTLALATSPLMVFVAAMFKNPRSLTFDRLNLLCGLLAVTGIVIWRITSQPEIAIIVAILADIASSFPTIFKTIRRPKTEYAPTYAISALSMIVMLLTVRNWSFVAVAFPTYVLVINFFMVGLITVSRRALKRRQTLARRKLRRLKQAQKAQLRQVQKQHRAHVRLLRRQYSKIAK
jgi:hypothetical protein